MISILKIILFITTITVFLLAIKKSYDKSIRCDKCGAEMRLEYVLQSNPLKYQYVCPLCGNRTILDVKGEKVDE